MSTLDTILAHQGYVQRPQQTALYERLLGIDTSGVVVQAGTGTGKSIAVLAAAADWYTRTGKPTMVITPTKALQDQYLASDGPAVEAALGISVRMLKGRNNYACPNAIGWELLASNDLPRWLEDIVPSEEEALRRHIGFTGRSDYFGCPGSDICKRETVEDEDGKIVGYVHELWEEPCHYRRAKYEAQQADIIVTNTALWLVNDMVPQAEIFPECGALLVDEAHMLEPTIRDFGTRALPLPTIASFGEQGAPLAALVERANTRDAKAQRLPAAPARPLLSSLLDYEEGPNGETITKRQEDAQVTAAKMIELIDGGWYDNGDYVLWFDPAEHPKQPRIVSSVVNVSGHARRMLTAQPFALVSATVPRSMPPALGVPQVGYLDVGHPFDYARQATIAFSGWSGASAVAADTQEMRAEEVYRHIMSTGGGALVLFSAFSDLQYVLRQIRGRLERAGLLVLVQERDSDKKYLAQRFKEDGNAVLFGSDTFATGFDCPGTALRNVVLWKAPYPALDPVNRAIQAKDFKRYEDMMLMKATQGVGRLIRTATDSGAVYIADSRLRAKFRNPRDPMTAHLKDFTLVEAR